MRIYIATVMVAAIVFMTANPPHAADSKKTDVEKPKLQIPEDEKIWGFLKDHRNEMVRVTKTPYHVSWGAGTELCCVQIQFPIVRTASIGSVSSSARVERTC